MAVVKRFVGRHASQFDGSVKANANCTPTSLGNAARSATKGSVDKSGGAVRLLVKVSEEQFPASPGWSLKDADLAASRMGVNFTIVLGGSWSGLVARRAEGRMIVLQGDSDEFTSGCSSRFDGDHCIDIHPNENSLGEWLTGDPICSSWRWEDEATLRKYAENFGNGSVLYGFTDVVPVAENEEADVAVVITLVPEKGKFTIPANKAVIGYKVDPTTGLVAEQKTWTARSTPSSASYDARIVTTAFRGNPFLRASDGFFDDFWISAGQVDDVPDVDPVVDCSVQVKTAFAAGQADGIAQKSKELRERLGL